MLVLPLLSVVLSTKNDQMMVVVGKKENYASRGFVYRRWIPALVSPLARTADRSRRFLCTRPRTPALGNATKQRARRKERRALRQKGRVQVFAAQVVQSAASVPAVVQHVSTSATFPLHAWLPAHLLRHGVCVRQRELHDAVALLVSVASQVLRRRRDDGRWRGRVLDHVGVDVSREEAPASLVWASEALVVAGRGFPVLGVVRVFPAAPALFSFRDGVVLDEADPMEMFHE